MCVRREVQQQAAGAHPETFLLLHRHKTQTTARTLIVRTALSQQAAKTTGEGYLLVKTFMPHNTCSLPQAVRTCCCSAATPAPVPTPPPPARKKASVITAGEVKGTVYTSDGRRVASHDGALGDTLFEGDKLGTGQYVEVRRVRSWGRGPVGMNAALKGRILALRECMLPSYSHSCCVMCASPHRCPSPLRSAARLPGHSRRC